MRRRDFSTRPEPASRGRALVVVGALVLALAAQQALLARSARDRAQAQVEDARRGVGELRQRLERLERRGSGGGAEATVVSRALMASAAPPSRVLGDVVALLPPGVRLDALDLAYGPTVELNLQVVARAARDYDEFIERLARSEHFSAVEPGAERRDGELRVGVRVGYRPGSGR